MHRHANNLVALAGLMGSMLLPGGANALPIVKAESAMPTGEAQALIERAQYVTQGRRYCWYGDGWNGGGWYRCGYAWRQGQGWGGPSGWQGRYRSGASDPRYWDHHHDMHGRWGHGRSDRGCCW